MTKDDRIDVLDHGYVRLVDHMGSDLTVVNAARVSFEKQSFELSDADRRLIAFLASNDHTSPFRHATLQFEVYAPLMVTRQWWKYIVGGDHVMDAWNESSRRYVTEEPEFYTPWPDEWREAPSNRKQGSGGTVYCELGLKATERLIETVDKGVANYQWALDNGVCAEQARLFLPAYALYVRWYWTSSLQGVAHFLNQRLDEHAQFEIRQYAQAVYKLAKPLFPTSIEELVGETKEGE